MVEFDKARLYRRVLISLSFYAACYFLMKPYLPWLKVLLAR